MEKLFVGIDVGSSSVKTAIYDGESGKAIGTSAYPKNEQRIEAPNPGWAEQDPEMWWTNFKKGFQQIVTEYSIDTKKIAAIGISYQMHGLVVVDEDQNVLRKSIIWCDSRAVDIGSEAFQKIGKEKSLQTLLNSPGNFTASKLSWVKQNEPDTYGKVHKFMLPGDYVAMKLSGKITTTTTGLSEGVFWNFPEEKISEEVLNHYGFSEDMVADLVPAIGDQVTVSQEMADELGLSSDVKVTYRAGDQPNNAFSLNVLEPGQIAATAGTSGVIYAVTDKDVYDPKSRINTFLHVNNKEGSKRNGILICVNGTGILYSWLKRLLNTGSDGSITYESMNDFAREAPVGAEGVQFYPFGNGAERILENQILNANLMNMDFNRHDSTHILRSAMEGITFALNLGFDILKNNEVPYDTIRAGHANLFLSKVFRSIFANVTESVVELYDTDGSVGAARGAALGAGFYNSAEEAFSSLELVDRTEPQKQMIDKYNEVYGKWKEQLNALRD